MQDEQKSEYSFESRFEVVFNYLIFVETKKKGTLSEEYTTIDCHRLIINKDGVLSVDNSLHILQVKEIRNAIAKAGPDKDYEKRSDKAKSAFNFYSELERLDDWINLLKGKS